MIVRPVRAVGTVKHDETRLTIVTMRSDGFIEELFVNKTGQHVHAGEPLFRVYSPDIQRAQVDLIVRCARAAWRARHRTRIGSSRAPCSGCAISAFPRAASAKSARQATIRRTLDWPAPATGDVIEKRVINGQQVKAGDELYRIADHSHLWVIADVAEATCPPIKLGTRATVTVRAYMAEPIEGEVTFIYPELRDRDPHGARAHRGAEPRRPAEGRHVCRRRVPGRRRRKPVIAVPGSAVIDSGTRQVVLVAKGEGRFEPRPVKLGAPRRRLRRGAGGRERGRGGRHLGDLPDRRRKQSEGGAAGLHAAGGAEMIAALIRWSARNVLPGRDRDRLRDAWPASMRSRACRSTPFPTSPTCR